MTIAPEGVGGGTGSGEARDVALTLHFLHEMSHALGIDRSWIERLRFRDDVHIRSPFACTDLAAASFAACGAALAQLVSAGGGRVERISVSRAMASEWFRFPPLAPHWPVDAPADLGVPLSARGERASIFASMYGTAPAVFANVYPTADDRWVFLRGGGAKVLDALGVDDDVEQVAAAIRSAPADEVEQIVIEAGGTAAANRTLAQWAAHPQGRAVAAEPLVHVTPGSATTSSWRPTPGRPLAGIRVLDLTRVVAGPTGTRFLAACGAEVLRIDAPDSAESRPGWMDPAIVLGKRWALLDLRSPAGRERFLELLSQADVFVHGYRPGAIDALVSPADRAQARPGLVEVTLNAYGWTGDWRTRRGFDTTTQWSTGLADATRTWALEDPERRMPINSLGRLVDASRPRHMPVEALDFATGHLIAAAAISGLHRRLVSGTGSLSRLSLARTAALLVGGGLQGERPWIPVPLRGELQPGVFTVNGRPTRRLRWPLEVEGNPLFWEHRGDVVAGASTPRWADSGA